MSFHSVIFHSLFYKVLSSNWHHKFISWLLSASAACRDTEATCREDACGTTRENGCWAAEDERTHRRVQWLCWPWPDDPVCPGRPLCPEALDRGRGTDQVDPPRGSPLQISTDRVSWSRWHRIFSRHIPPAFPRCLQVAKRRKEVGVPIYTMS